MILILVLVILLLSTVFLGYKMLTESTPTTTTSSTSTVTPTNNFDVALTATGVIQPGQENFEDTIVFNSFDTIKNNFNKAMEIYFPLINMNTVQQHLTNNNVNQSIQDIINSKTNLNIELFFMSGIMQLYALIAFCSDDSNNIIYLGLFLILIMKINTLERLAQENKTLDVDFYYLNDYETVGEFYLYIIPKTYNINNINNLKTDTNITELGNNYDLTRITEPSKTSLNKALMMLIKNILSQKNNIPVTEITDTQVNEFKTIIKSNQKPLTEYLNISTAGPFIALSTPVTESSKIVSDMFNLISSPTNFTDSFKPYIETPNDSMKTSLVIVFNNTFSIEYQMQRQLQQQSSEPPASSQEVSPSFSPDMFYIYSDINYTGDIAEYALNNIPTQNDPYALYIFDSSFANRTAVIRSFKIDNKTNTIYKLYANYFNGTIAGTDNRQRIELTDLNQTNFARDDITVNDIIYSFQNLEIQRIV